MLCSAVDAHAAFTKLSKQKEEDERLKDEIEGQNKEGVEWAQD